MDEVNHNPVVFEVGRFYLVQPSPFSRKIPALCTRKLKKKIEFDYLSRFDDGKVAKCTATRYFRTDSSGNERAWSSDTWSGISSTEATEVAEKPKMWDEVKERI